MSAEASMWWCGDEECDCTEPQLCYRNYAYVPGGGLVARGPMFTTLWRGTFYSRAEYPDEYMEQQHELAIATDWAMTINRFEGREL